MFSFIRTHERVSLHIACFYKRKSFTLMRVTRSVWRKENRKIKTIITNIQHWDVCIYQITIWLNYNSYLKFVIFKISQTMAALLIYYLHVCWYFGPFFKCLCFVIWERDYAMGLHKLTIYFIAATGIPIPTIYSEFYLLLWWQLKSQCLFRDLQTWNTHENH